MALILTSALMAVTALALPNPINTLAPRDIPQPIGFSQGIAFLDLTFKIYPKSDCKGSPAGNYQGSYGFYDAYQMQSYHLSRTLYDDEVLDFYSGSATDSQPNNTIDHALDGHYTEACYVLDVTAGSDATTDDDDNSKGRKQGCHTLKHNEWCAMIWRNSTSNI